MEWNQSFCQGVDWILSQHCCKSEVSILIHLIVYIPHFFPLRYCRSGVHNSSSKAGSNIIICFTRNLKNLLGLETVIQLWNTGTKTQKNCHRSLSLETLLPTGTCSKKGWEPLMEINQSILFECYISTVKAN